MSSAVSWSYPFYWRCQTEPFAYYLASMVLPSNSVNFHYPSWYFFYVWVTDHTNYPHRHYFCLKLFSWVSLAFSFCEWSHQARSLHTLLTLGFLTSQTWSFWWLGIFQLLMICLARRSQLNHTHSHCLHIRLVAHLELPVPQTQSVCSSELHFDLETFWFFKFIISNFLRATLLTMSQIWGLSPIIPLSSINQ